MNLHYNLRNTKYLNRRLRSTKLRSTNLTYTLSFKSLLPFTLPSVLFTVLDKFNSHGGSRKSGFKRFLIKNSYILFTWFYYLNSLVTSGNPFKSSSVPSFFIKPSRTSTFTTVKAPMAHRTFSQEQYKMRFYGFSFSFTFRNLPCVSGLNYALYFVAFFRDSFFFFETNLFSLNRLRLSFLSSDKSFFKLI